MPEKEKQIQQLPGRNLSLRGKTILLNTLILSKVTFLSNLLSIPTLVQQQIETYVFKHIWQFSEREPLARTKLFLPKNQGGIGLIQPKYHSLAM